MPASFHRLTIQEFAALLDRFYFTRRIDSIHLHHTGRPNHRQYRGHETMVELWQRDTQRNGWGDIAQHLTIGPDGTIWLGRNWNLPPASAAGHNGNAIAGPFMVTMIGDFDYGRDRFEGQQREVALQVIALIQQHFNLEPETLRFHSHMSTKSCPGTAIDYKQMLKEVRELRTTLRKNVEKVEKGPFGDEALKINELLESFKRNIPAGADPWNAEPSEEGMRDIDFYRLASAGTAMPSLNGRGDAARAPKLTPEMLDELRLHVINLVQGQFSADGEIRTTPSDVDAIFEEHLVRELEGARARKEKLRLVFYAHGGLVSESNALWMAYQHVAWWKQNNVYPIYFIWETGLFETIGQLLTRSHQRLQRAIARDIWDVTTDPVLETVVRALYGPTIWSGMKRSAERSVDQAGGARYTAEKLKAFWAEHGDKVELHAIGHSAGSNFHGHFIPAAIEAGVPSFRSVHLLAPAIRVDTFQQQLAEHLGKGINHLSIFTMRKDLEQADHCMNIYHKSLLYLIYYALESEPKTPILGLETSLRENPELRQLLGLGGQRSPVGEVIWSVTPTNNGLSASTSRSHGNFDNDAPTMNSVLRRILGKDDNDPIVTFPPEATEARGGNLWEDQVDWPEELEVPAWAGNQNGSLPLSRPVVPVPAITPSPIVPQFSQGGRRQALCVGINRYPTQPLAGCVADAQLWAGTLAQMGFEQPVLLLDEQASRTAILATLSNLITSRTTGDVIVFQFAGHGTQLLDVNGDEAGEDSSNQDEALCPYDFESGAFIIDDDVAEIFARIPDGVNVTCFIDCCHSGTISRLGVGATPQVRARGQDQRVRYLRPSQAMIEAHRQFRQRLGQRRAFSSRGPESMREVLFSACLSAEVAWESDGQGDFTLQATQLLRAGIDGMTNEQFLQRVMAAFGQTPRQHPELDCALTARGLSLLQPLASGIGLLPLGAGRAAAVNGNMPGQTTSTAQLLRLIATALESRG